MNHDEFNQGFHRLQQGILKGKQGLLKESGSVYLSVLAEFDNYDWSLAVERALRQFDSFPSIRELRALCEEVRQDRKRNKDAKNEREQWEKESGPMPEKDRKKLEAMMGGIGKSMPE